MDKSHLTAITRNKLSSPMRYLLESNLLDINAKRLDYGCGKGFDADHLGMVKYDPHFFPIKPEGKFGLITCNYVFNVIQEDKELDLICELESYLRDDGVCYISVRRDVFEDGFTSRGTFQRNVILDLPVQKEIKKRFAIYKLIKKD